MRRELSGRQVEARRRALMLIPGNLTVVLFLLLFPPGGLSGLARLICAALSCGTFTLCVEVGLRRARHRSAEAPQT